MDKLLSEIQTIDSRSTSLAASDCAHLVALSLMACRRVPSPESRIRCQLTTILKL